MKRTRGERDQRLHDWLIQEKVKQSYGSIRREGHTVCTNPSQQHNCDVNGLYPDIVTFDRNSHKPTIIDEVETFVDEPEFSQWQKFGGLRIRFVVTIPAKEVRRAKEGIEEMSIPVNEIWCYDTDGLTASIWKAPW